MNLIIKKSGATKNLRISVRADGRVTVSAPRMMPDFLVRQFVKRKMNWIEEKLAYFQKHPVVSLHPSIKPRMTAANKQLAFDLVSTRLAHFNQFYNFEYKRVAIRNQKTRWGSCSKQKNLNFNYKIIYLTPAQQDYIVVHELCHLAEFNHGKKFWELVTQQIPEYKSIRASIKKFRL